MFQPVEGGGIFRKPQKNTDLLQQPRFYSQPALPTHTQTIDVTQTWKLESADGGGVWVLGSQKLYYSYTMFDMNSLKS